MKEKFLHHCTKLHGCNLQQEQGGALLSAVISIGILAFMVTTAASFYSKSLLGLHVAENRTKFLPILNVVDAYVVKKAELILEIRADGDTCTTLGGPGGRIAEVLLEETLTSANLSIMPADATNLLPVPDEGFGYRENHDARQRCLAKTVNMTTPNQATATSLDYCLVIEAANSDDVSVNEILQAQPLFVEVRYDLTDFDNGRPIPCGEFRDAALHPARGGKIYYTIYWSMRHSGGRFIHGHWTEFYYAATRN